MNDLSESEVRVALDAAGRGPTDESRRRLRAALLDDDAGGAAPAGRRRLGPVVGATLAVAAAIVGVLVFAARDHDDAQIITGNPDDTPAQTSHVSVPTSSPTSLMAASVSGHRWILDSLGDEPWTNPIVPFLDPVISGSTWQADGYDGCNQLDLRGEVVDDSLVLRQAVSTEMACGDLAGVGPRQDEVLTLDDGGRLSGPSTGLVYRSFDDDSPSITWPDVVGSWQLDGWEPRIDVNGFVVTIGTCAMTASPGSVLLTGWPANPPDCLGSSAPRAANLLIGLLSAAAAAEPPVGHVLDGRLLLTGSGTAVQLTRVEPVTDPGGIVIETGAAFGLVPGTVVSVDDELARLEGVVGRVHHDTGWYSVPVTTYEDGTEDCLGGRSYRVLWWGDLSLAFWRGDDGQESLWAWSVGDKRVSLWGDRRESYSPPPGTAPLWNTETEIGIGTSEADLVTTYGDRLAKFDPSAEDFGGTVYDSGGQGWPFVASGAGVGSTFLVRDGVVVGFGSSLRFC